MSVLGVFRVSMHSTTYLFVHMPEGSARGKADFILVLKRACSDIVHARCSLHECCCYCLLGAHANSPMMAPSSIQPNPSVQSLCQPSSTPSACPQGRSGWNHRTWDLSRRPKAPAPIHQNPSKTQRVVCCSWKWRRQNASGCSIEAFTAPESRWSSCRVRV